MKRLLILSLAVALFLTACSGPVYLTSPSKSNQTESSLPDSQIGRSSDYDGLIKLIRKAQTNQSNYPNRYYMKDMAGAPTFSEAQASAGKNNNFDYSKTNIQVEGVDEADIIKTDGSYLYIIANNQLYVVDARNPAQLEVISKQSFVQSQETDKITTGENPVEMFLDVENGRLILIVNGWINEKIPLPTETIPTDTQPTELTETKPSETSEATSSSEETSVLPSESSQETTAETSPAESSATPPAETVTGTLSANAGVSSSEAKAPDMAISKDFAARIWFPYYNQKQYTTTRIYDLADKTEPRLVRQFSQTGSYVTARKIGSAVYVVTNQYQYRVYFDANTEPDPADLFPATCDTKDPVTLENWETLPADKITILPQGDVSSQLVLSAIDTINDESKPDLLSVLGYSGTVYASTNYLYVAGFNYQWDGREGSQPVYSTDIFRFKLSGARISEAGKGSVPGNILNQFSLDEYNGYFRVATTTNEWTNVKDNMINANKNHVYVLDPSLKIVGKVVDLAPGESIKSVRFMGDKVYVVTFRDVDPLFVIDLAKPSDPKVLGQLKIPGYSTYLHPYETDKLLGFGYDVKSEGGNAYNMGLKVSLFDISDFSNPKEMSTILLGGRGSYADILNNHKTLLFSLEKNLVAFPATLNKTITNNPLEYGQPVFQGLLLLEIDSSYQIKLRGQVTHFDKLSDPSGDPKPLTEKEAQAFYGYDAIFRGAYIGDTLFTFSSRQVRAADLATLVQKSAVELPGYDEYQNYSYYGGVIPETVRAVE
jgi:inhibitor of cysteine peptidase